MEGFRPERPIWGASAGREGVGWVVHVRAAVVAATAGPGNVGMGNREGKKLNLRGFPPGTARFARVGGP